jgi:hypothetical protein
MVRFDDVKDRAGTAYQLVGTPLSLTLDKVEELPVSHGREGGSFRLEFVGPLDPMLPQAMYALGNDAGEYEIFLVPIEREAQAMRYEAIFN